MTGEPAWLECNRTAANGPQRSVGRQRHAAALSWRISQYPDDRSEGIFLHGYIHCIPYGKVLFGPTPRPPESTNCSSVPFVCKLSPLHPGYVMTVCAKVMVRKAEKTDALARKVENMARERERVETVHSRRGVS